MLGFSVFFFFFGGGAGDSGLWVPDPGSWACDLGLGVSGLWE